jgi:hypothetical protein
VTLLSRDQKELVMGKSGSCPQNEAGSQQDAAIREAAAQKARAVTLAHEAEQAAYEDDASKGG